MTVNLNSVNATSHISVGQAQTSLREGKMEVSGRSYNVSWSPDGNSVKVSDNNDVKRNGIQQFFHAIAEFFRGFTSDGALDSRAQNIQNNLNSSRAMHSINDSRSEMGNYGLNKNSSDAEINKAYKKYAIAMHTDKGGSHEDFVKLNNTFEVLRAKA